MKTVHDAKISAGTPFVPAGDAVLDPLRLRNENISHLIRIMLPRVHFFGVLSLTPMYCGSILLITIFTASTCYLKLMIIVLKVTSSAGITKCQPFLK